MAGLSGGVVLEFSALTSANGSLEAVSTAGEGRRLSLNSAKGLNSRFIGEASSGSFSSSAAASFTCSFPTSEESLDTFAAIATVFSSLDGTATWRADPGDSERCIFISPKQPRQEKTPMMNQNGSFCGVYNDSAKSDICAIMLDDRENGPRKGHRERKYGMCVN